MLKAMEKPSSYHSFHGIGNLERMPHTMHIEKKGWFGGHRMSGIHKSKGILIMKGPNIKNGLQMEPPSIMDVAPTILYLMGYHIPSDMDGKVISQAIKEDYLRERPVEFSGLSIDRFLEDKDGYSQEEDREIKDNLRHLGYLK